jgi:hypothetical protein
MIKQHWNFRDVKNISGKCKSGYFLYEGEIFHGQWVNYHICNKVHVILIWTHTISRGLNQMSCMYQNCKYITTSV